MEIRISGGLDDQLFPFGCTLKDGRAIFCIASDCEKLYLRLYRSGRFYKKIEFPAEYRMGDVWRMAMEGIPADGSFSYTYEIDGHEAADIYGQFTEGRETFGKRAHGGRPVRTVIRESSGTVGKSLQGSRAHFIPYEDCIIYRLHVRGFTRDKSSGLSEELRGTFAGAAEMIPYIRELGANVIELMPAYEYNELERQRAGAQRINYWGFTQDAMRFAPKEAFGGEKGFRKLLEDLHGAGMELVLGMYFAGNEPEDQVLSVIRNWRLRYGIDGVHIVGYAPMKLLLNDPYLKGMKLWADSIDPSDLRRESSEGPYAKKEEKALSDSCAAAYNDSFQNDIRRFIKGDEGMVRRAMELYKDIPGVYARINYTANVSGFSLWDVFSYDRKHNEANGEHGTDGTDFNYSWNCGEEGPSRKKRINELRMRLCRNAMLLTILSLGTPLINAGDEMYHTRKGNNNSWCMDSALEWINWDDLKKHEDMVIFTRRLLDLRRSHPVFRRHEALKQADYRVTGLPDISFHGESAWKVDLENFRRQLGICLNGDYAKRPDGSPDDSFYIAINMHWESHELSLPKLPSGKSWRKLADTSLTVPFADEAEAEPLSALSVKLAPRSIAILIGK